MKLTRAEKNNLLELIKADKINGIELRFISANWILKIRHDGLKSTLLQHAAELGGAECFRAFGIAMCERSVWSGATAKQRAALEMDFFYAISTFYTRRIIDHVNDPICEAVVRSVCEAFFVKDGNQLLLAKRSPDEYDKFGGAFDQARVVFEYLSLSAKEQDALNSALTAAAPPGIVPRSL